MKLIYASAAILAMSAHAKFIKSYKYLEDPTRKAYLDAVNDWSERSAKDLGRMIDGAANDNWEPLYIEAPSIYRGYDMYDRTVPRRPIASMHFYHQDRIY